MKIKDAFLSGLFSFLYIIASIIICMVVEAMLLFFIDKIIYVPYPVQTIIRVIIYTVGGAVLLGFLAYHEGYREAACAPVEVILGVIFAAVPHLLLSLLFHFQGFIAGGVRFVAGLCYYGWDITHELVAETPLRLFLSFFARYTLLYAAVLTVFKYMGAKRRLIDRAELKKAEVEPAIAEGRD